MNPVTLGHRGQVKRSQIVLVAVVVLVGSSGVGSLSAGAKAGASPHARGLTAPRWDDRATPAAQSPPPTAPLKKGGLSQDGVAPSHPTGAISPTQYIEAVNLKVGIYDRELDQLTSATLATWFGLPGGSVHSPQVIWDPTTSRFYFTGAAAVSAELDGLVLGWSKTSTPNNLTSDWCRISLPYDDGEMPVNPELGDSRDFVIIGVNTFREDGSAFLRSDIIALGKPPPGTSCPSLGETAGAVAFGLDVAGVDHVAPVPANQIDTNATGWVLTVPLAQSPYRELGLFKVNRDPSTGFPVVQRSGRSVPVPAYGEPEDVPQPDTPLELGTIDSRLGQAVAAVDPARGNALHLWTQHTVSGAAGARIRWYEIEPLTPTVAQTGVVGSPSLFVFNGAISPDRVVRGGVRAFGSNMVLAYNTSSSSSYPAIRMVSKRGSADVSAPVLVRASAGHYEDGTCGFQGRCRWGESAAATPDPAADTAGVTGAVWVSQTWTLDADQTDAFMPWRTLNFQAVP